MFVIRIVVCFFVVIKADEFNDLEDDVQHFNSNYVNQRLDNGITQPLSRNKRQSVIRNSQPGQNPQVQGIELSPSLFIYLDDEKDLESLLINKTIDDIINTAERKIQSNTKTQYPINTIHNGQNPQYQQHNHQISSVMNYNGQAIYNNRNPAVIATTETLLISYDQLSPYTPQESTVLNNNNKNDKIFFQVDENITIPDDRILSVTKSQPIKTISNNQSLERDNIFRYPSTQVIYNNFPPLHEKKDSVYSDINRSAGPQEIPLSIMSIPNNQPIRDNTDNIKNDPHTKDINKEIEIVYDSSTKNHDENGPYDGLVHKDDSTDRRTDNHDTQSPNFDSSSLGNGKETSDYNRKTANIDRSPPYYDRRPYDYDRTPSDYGRRSYYNRHPTYDRFNGAWDRRPNYGRGEPFYGWRPPYHGRGPPYRGGPPPYRGGSPPYRGGPPPYTRGRGPPQKDKQPPYIINLNFDSKGVYNNGTLLNDNGTLTEKSNGKEQNPNIYETLKSIFNPNQGVALSNTDEEQLNEKSTIPGLYQVTPVTPAT